MMNVLKYITIVSSDTIHIAGLDKFFGKKVEILITEKKESNGNGDALSKFFSLSGKIDIDDDAIRSLRDTSKL